MADAVGWSGAVCGCRLCMGAADGGTTAQPQYDVRVPGSLPYYTAALLPSSQPHWGATLGSGTTVTYSFMTTAPSYASTEDRTGFAAMTGSQQTAVRLALNIYSAVSGLRFQEVDDTGAGGSIRFGTNSQSSSSGYAYYPSTAANGGDVYIANSLSYNLTPTIGTAGFAVILHEIGHAVGLKHPGNYNAGGGGGAETPYLPTAEDNTANTVMSYTNTVTAESLQPFDVAALQYLYGVNTSARVTNDLYTFNMGGGLTPLVWDGGGNDTLSGAGQTTNLYIDLRQGAQSWIGTPGSSILTAGNLAINYGTVIENAVGGSGADTIVGNDADNVFDGGAGADSIDGSNGIDTVTYATSATAVNVSLATGVGQNGSAAGDILANIENLIGSIYNDTLGGSAAANRLDGGDGVDTVTYASSTAAVDVRLDAGTASGGYATSDVLISIENLIGSAYDDTLSGTATDNWLAGGGGNDVLYGQGGADSFDGGDGFDTAIMGGTGGTILCTAVESLIGTAGQDYVSLGAGGNTMTVNTIETLVGSANADWVTLGNTGNTLILAAVETLIGGIGADWANLGNRGNTLILAGIETLIGGANGDLVTLGNRGNTLILAGIETLIGGANGDLVTLGNRGNTMVIGAVETLVGGTAMDLVTLADSGNTLRLSGVEALIGGAGADVVTLDGAGVTVILAGIETLTGTSGGDWINLGNRGSTMTLFAAETLVGGAGNDVVTLGGTGGSIILAAIEALAGTMGADHVTLGNRGNTITIREVETVTGGTGGDFVTFGAEGSMSVTGVETIVGSAGNDIVTLNGNGYTLTVAGVETLAGTAGGDWINLGNRGNTVRITGVETLIGGANTDIAVLGDNGATLILTAVETLVGSTGADVITLGNRGNTISVSSVETLTGGSNTDDVTVIGLTRFEGRGGSDTVRLQVGANVDLVVFSSLDDGGPTHDTVWNFTATTDRLMLTGAARLAVDRNTDGQLAAVDRGTGQAVLATDELVRLTATVSSLTDADHASFRQSLGTVAAGSSGITSLVLANDGTNSGLYAVTDNGDGVITAGEVRMLALVTASRVAAGDVVLG